MLFCLSLCDHTGRVVLDQDLHGEVLAMVEGKDWKEARREALRNKVLDSFIHVKGHGWMSRKTKAPSDGESAGLSCINPLVRAEGRHG